MADYNEEHFEQTLIELFSERLGYDYQGGYDIQSTFEEKDYYCPVYRERLRAMLRQLNKALSQTDLASLRDTLLPRLMSGKIKVGDLPFNN